jgi:hypothetical protein
MGCGGGEASLTEYAETLDALAVEMSGQLVTGAVQMSSETATIEDAQAVLAEGLVVRAEFQAAMPAHDPPDVIADLRTDLVDLHARIIAAEEALAARTETTTGFEELNQSEELQALWAMQTEVVSLCEELHTRIDTTADHELFADVPWIPGDLKEVVELTLGC